MRVPERERRVIVMRGKNREWGSDGEVEMVGDDQERWREKRRGIEVGEGVGDGSSGAIRAASVRGRPCHHLTVALRRWHHRARGGASS